MLEKSQTYLIKVNTGLSWIAVVLALYILVSPFAGQLKFWFLGENEDISAMVEITSSSPQDVDELPKEDSIIIPSINLVAPIGTGGPEVLLSSVWHRPGTAFPDQGGNIALSAHRYLRGLDSNYFYNLDKVALGDKVAIVWGGEKYVYEVDDIFVVGPNDTWIEEPTEADILTMYTCTPLLTGSQRLVVRAHLITQ